jgi:hypothetical protein
MKTLATSTRALQWGPGVATPLPRVKLNTADSGGSTPLQTALAHKTQNGLRKVSPQTVQVLPMSWTKCVTYVLTQPSASLNSALSTIFQPLFELRAQASELRTFVPVPTV